MPRSIPPFPDETTSSYLARLAAANRLHVTRLRILLTGASVSRPIEARDLAAASGRPLQSLHQALPELRPGFVPPRGRPVLISPRPPCRRCIARRGISAPVTCWLPTEVNICPTHRIWLGAPARHGNDTEHEQHDLADLPQLVHAQRRHWRLSRRHGRRTTAEAFAEATHVTSCWARRGHYVERRLPLMQILRGAQPSSARLHRDDPLIPIVTYPETVALAFVLAQPQWRHPPALYEDLSESGFAIYHFNREVNRQVGIGHRTHNGYPDPLTGWFYKRRRLAHEAFPEQARTQ